MNPTYANDYINGNYNCACPGNSKVFYDPASGEFQCGITCSSSPLCEMAWSYQDGQFNPVCDPV